MSQLNSPSLRAKSWAEPPPPVRGSRDGLMPNWPLALINQAQAAINSEIIIEQILHPLLPPRDRAGVGVLFQHAGGQCIQPELAAHHVRTP